MVSSGNVGIDLRVKNSYILVMQTIPFFGADALFFFQKENSKIAWITSFYLKEELLNIWASTFPF